MNASLQAFNQYQKTAVETVAPGKLLIMLFDGAVKNILNAQKAIEDKDYNNAHQQIIKTQDILVELMATLNMDYEISKSLYSLYDFMYNQLVEANINKDTTILENVRVFLVDLKNTWQEAIKVAGNTVKPAVNNHQGLSIKG